MNPKEESPLFTPALWEGNRFRVLDETLLPWKLDYITVHDASVALQSVKEMRTRAFGQVLTFLYTAALVAQEYKDSDPRALEERLTRLTEEFCRARPTFDFKGLARFFPEWFRELPAGEEAGRWIAKRLHEFAASIISARLERARRVAEILPNPCRLLTHCNISGELVAVARSAQEIGKEITLIATETRPYLQGSRLTAWELLRAGIKVCLIPDCAIAQVMANGKVDAVLVGSDRCARNGDVINKVGTYPVALMAKRYGIPFYALVQHPGSASTGAEIAIEERPASELLTFQGRSLVPQGAQEVAGRYPAFDLTPASLISSLIGFHDTFTPESFRQRFLKVPAATERRNGKDQEGYLLLYGIPRRSHYAYLSHSLQAEKIQKVLLPEMRPELWGVHAVLGELLERRIPTTLISDNTMGTLFAQGAVRRLVLSYLRLNEEGPVGLCGALLAALLARAHGVPVELVEGEESLPATVDRDISTFLGRSVVPEGAAIYPVEKEVIPWNLLKGGVS